MRVVQINSVCGRGSTGRIVVDLHSVLLQHGHESIIACGRDRPRNYDTAIRIGTDVDVCLHVALTRFCDMHGFGSRKATAQFVKYLSELKPDIIHLHNLHGYYLNIEVLFEYLKKVDVPVIWTLHDCWSFTGHCSHFDYVQCDRWRSGCYACPEKKSYPSSYIFDRSRINYVLKRELFTGVKNLTIVTPSRWLAAQVLESFLREYPVKVIPNGIDLSIFQPIESDFREKHNIQDRFIILGVASPWTKRKGLEYFLELSDQLNNDEVIVLVGLSEAQLRKLPKRIIGVARTDSPTELAAIYSAVDVFVNPTLEDNFPTTNLEALACGTPVITFDTGGSSESIDRTCGFVISKGDIRALLDRIGILRGIGKDYYRNNCRLRAEKLYRKEDRFMEYLRLYEDCVT